MITTSELPITSTARTNQPTIKLTTTENSKINEITMNVLKKSFLNNKLVNKENPGANGGVVFGIVAVVLICLVGFVAMGLYILRKNGRIQSYVPSVDCFKHKSDSTASGLSYNSFNEDIQIIDNHKNPNFVE